MPRVRFDRGPVGLVREPEVRLIQHSATSARRARSRACVRREARRTAEYAQMARQTLSSRSRMNSPGTPIAGGECQQEKRGAHVRVDHEPLRADQGRSRAVAGGNRGDCRRQRARVDPGGASDRAVPCRSELAASGHLLRAWRQHPQAGSRSHRGPANSGRSGWRPTARTIRTPTAGQWGSPNSTCNPNRGRVSRRPSVSAGSAREDRRARE